MDLQLDGLRAVVLGGSRGIGWYTADLLASEGVQVALCARGAEGVTAAVNSLPPVPQGSHFGEARDLMDAEAPGAFIRSVVEQFGGLDILIHNASGFDRQGDEDGWQRSFQIDMMAGVRAVDAALPTLQVSKGSSITFIGSMASKFYFRRRSSYGPAKAAMRAYANELAQSYGRDGVRANVVSPGAVYFPGGSWDTVKQEQPEFYRNVEKGIPLGRLGTAAEIARIVAFVASPAGIWINSTHIAADGGQVAAVD
ncbi:MAG: SDR family NAD(P)-dependent oxidoreductase [Pseudomonadales bacterium]